MRERFFRRRAVDGERGMTLIEIMIVVAIIGLIMGGAAVVAINQWKKAQVKDAERTVHVVTSAIELFSTQSQNPCPANLDELVTSGLIKSKATKDAWGEALIFACPGLQNRGGADVMSKGPDRKEGTEDDIKGWDL